MSKDTITVNMNVYDIPIVVEQLNKLQQENKKYKDVIDKAIDLIEKSGTTDIGIDSNNNIIHYHQLTEADTDELSAILKEVEPMS